MKGFAYLAVFAAAAFALCIHAPPEGAQPVTSSVQIPLGGTVFVPLSDGSTDAVALSGMVHVVTHVPQIILPTDPIRIMINLDQVSGVGDISGLRYRVEESSSADGTYWIKRIPRPILMLRDAGDTIIHAFEPYMLLSAARSLGSLVPSINYVLFPNPKGPNPGGHRFIDNQEALVSTIIGWLKESKL